MAQTQTKAARAPRQSEATDAPAARASEATGTAMTVVREEDGPFKAILLGRRNDFAAVLPGHISVDRFLLVVQTAMRADPALREADKNSLLTACLQAANDGLLPDKKEGAIVVFKTQVDRPTGRGHATEKVTVKIATWMPMIKGVIKKAYNTGMIASIRAEIVYSADEYKRSAGTNADLVHVPNDFAPDRGEMIGCYVVIRLTEANAEPIVEVMSRAQVMKVKAVSKGGGKDGSPWQTFESEMWKKSVVRRGLKLAPSTPELERVLSRDESLFDLGRNRALLAAPEHEPVPQAALFAKTAHKKADPNAAPAADNTIEGEFEVVRDDTPAGMVDDEETIARLEGQFVAADSDGQLDAMISMVQGLEVWATLTEPARNRILMGAEVVRTRLERSGASEGEFFARLFGDRPAKAYADPELWKADLLAKLSAIKAEHVHNFWLANSEYIESAIALAPAAAGRVIATFAIKGVAGAKDLIDSKGPFT